MKGKAHTTVRIWAPDFTLERPYYDIEVKTHARLCVVSMNTEIAGNAYPNAVRLALYQIIGADLSLTENLAPDTQFRIKEQWGTMLRDLAEAVEQGDLDP